MVFASDVVRRSRSLFRLQALGWWGIGSGLIFLCFFLSSAKRAKLQADAYPRALDHAKQASARDQLSMFLRNPELIQLAPPTPLRSINQVAVTTAGRLVVLDTMSPSVEMFSPNGRFIGKMGSRGTRPGQYETPASFAVLPDGFAVVDFTKRRLNIYDQQGSFRDSFIYTPQRFAASRLAYMRAARRFVLSGNRWNDFEADKNSVHLLHFYGEDGDFLGSHFMLPQRFAALNLMVDDRLVEAEDGPDLLAALPFSDEIVRVDPDGQTALVLNHGFPLFKEPTTVPRLTKDNIAEFRAWELTWTPLVALAATSTHLFAEYQTFSPLRYTLCEWDRATSRPIAQYSTNSLLLYASADGRALFLKNIETIGDQPYELYQGQI